MMQSYRYAVLLLGVLLLVAGSRGAETKPQDDEARNLIVDGGFEKTREVIVAVNQHIYKLIDNGMDLGEGPIVYLPLNFGMFSGKVKTFKLIEGTPGHEVHSGTRALILQGSYYLNINLKA